LFLDSPQIDQTVCLGLNRTDRSTQLLGERHHPLLDGVGGFGRS